MTPEQAAWVREHAWTKAMARTFQESPGFYLKCACQRGTTWYCANGKCGRCHRAKPGPPDWEDVICDKTGNRPLYFATPYQHPTPSITGDRRERVAQVWLADRTCRWVCSCPHHAQPGRLTYEAAVLPGLELLGASR